MIETEAPAKEPLVAGRAAPQPTGPAVAVTAVVKRFEGRLEPLTAISGMSFGVRPLERVAVVGPSGCGKSTMLELIAGLQEPTAGTLAVEGEVAPRRRLARCALMPQNDLLLPWRSALDNAALSLELQGIRRSDARRRTEPLFERFGLGQFARARPHELSGGMRQRVAFLRTLLAGKPVLLLDEPFGALDSITRARMQEWLVAALESTPRTVVLVTHDVEEALFLSDRVLVLSARPGRVTEEIDVSFDDRRPRRETVTSSRFVALKERALEALE